MKDYIEALREIKKENKDFKITLSRKEVLELVNEFDRLNNIINELDTFLKNKIDYFDKTAKDTILHEQMVIEIIYDYLQDLKGR